jgi:hypothetical protein
MALTRPKYSNIVDSDYKQSCRIVTTTNITLSGGAPDSYDGVSLSIGDRVLVTAQDTGSENGIYSVLIVGTGSNGTWTRSFDANDGARMTSGASVAIGEGSASGKTYRLTTADPITVGSTSLTWSYLAGTPGGDNTQVQFNGNGILSGSSGFTFDQSSGNLTVGRIRSTSGLFWSTNNTPITTGITYTASTTSPTSARAGDQWYNTSTEILYEYVNDGTSSYWVDIQTQTLSANTIACLPLTGGTVSGYANVFVATGAVVNASTLTLAGNVYGRGGIGYFDALQLTSTYSGATNPNKYIRLNPTGGIEIVNSAYSATIFSLSDSGIVNTSGSYQVAGKQAVNGPAFRAYIDSSQTITSGSQQKVTFGSETFDTNSNFASSTFTPTVEGYYQLNATVRISGSSGTGEVMLTIWKNGGEYARGTNEQGTEQGNNFYSMQVSDLAYANGTTDYFEIYIQQTSGGNRDTTSGTNISYFSGVMVRGA